MNQKKEDLGENVEECFALRLAFVSRQQHTTLRPLLEVTHFSCGRIKPHLTERERLGNSLLRFPFREKKHAHYMA